MSNQALRIQNFLKDFDSNINVFILNISTGILIKRIIQDNKVKFKSYDIDLTPKDYLDIRNLVKKRHPFLLQSNFYQEESLFLLTSPFYADVIKHYKEEIYLISVGDTLGSNNLKLNPVEFEEGLNKVQDDFNYFIIITKNNKIIDQKIFYCDRYREYVDALNNATFSRFLNLVKGEGIKDEKTLISCLIKEGIPKKIQEKYLDFWYKYNEFLDIIDELCYEIERHKIDHVEELKNINLKQLKTSLIKLLKYDIDKALSLLEEIT